MAKTTIGLLHPGAMGAAVGAEARACGARVLWASAGRSRETAARAGEAGLEDAGTVAAAVAASDAVVSVCPPHAALDLAREVAGLGFAGIYLDANAVSPETARAVGAAVSAAGARFVDGGIVGPPPHAEGTTRLYLSGDGAADVAAWFAGTRLEAIAVGDAPGAASALKMAYATWTKVGDSMLLAIRALAAAEGVDAALLAEWERSQPGTAERSERAGRGVPPKAWRFVGEMHEIAATFEAAGLPRGFGEAAAEVFERIAPLRAADAPDVDAAVDRLLGRDAPPAAAGGHRRGE